MTYIPRYGRRTINQAKVNGMHHDFGKGHTLQEIAKAYGVSYSTLSKIKGKGWDYQAYLEMMASATRKSRANKQEPVQTASYSNVWEKQTIFRKETDALYLYKIWLSHYALMPDMRLYRRVGSRFQDGGYLWTRVPSIFSREKFSDLTRMSDTHKKEIITAAVRGANNEQSKVMGRNK